MAEFRQKLASFRSFQVRAAGLLPRKSDRF
jgi:hypothetical protein